MRRIVLHIGYHKTGSTALQQFLFTHRRRLSEAGILYPVSEFAPKRAQHNVAFAVSPDYRFDPASLTFDKLAGLATERTEDTMVLSSEAFVECDPSAAAEMVRAFAHEVRASVDTIAFLRPQHAYINSTYWQLIRGFNEWRCFRAFAEHAGNRWPQLNYWQHLREWDDPASHMRLIPAPYTASRLEPNIQTVFFDAAGLIGRVDDLLDHTDNRWMNPTPGPLTVEVCRRLTKHIVRTRGGLRNLDPVAHSKLVGDVLRWSPRITGEDGTPFNGLDNALRDRIDQRFAKPNDALARRFWGADWRDVFEEDYERDLFPNEFDRDRVGPGQRLRVRVATWMAVRRAEKMLEAGPRPGSRSNPTVA